MTAATLISARSCLTLLSGLATGTAILTLRGAVAVEDLRPGDRVITRDHGAQPLRALEAVAARLAPIRIAAGGLGRNRPDRDLLMGPGTRLHLRDWRARAFCGTPRALLEVHHLIDGEFVTEERPRGLTLYTLTFDRPQIVYADGVEVGV
ncbi:Hint domain protein [Rubellimicrobium thermophilum DSM 16684]|uniref:Hint domain protein n=1 Tax=Rubellimicrobium thermophilum DSM 16684 TaxID=1123069 RepID=S9R0R7_9RHOB|nr:Hint domain-containing protein [Rubellimicrobium thermophilum]EPX87231.1 Hint domain protein [Rubellimicrobium thermophilum DSM 16684]